MRKSIAAVCGAVLFTLSSALFAAQPPLPVFPNASRLPHVTKPGTPIFKVGGNCWNQRTSCMNSCDPWDSFCQLDCECSYCYCAGLLAPLECSGSVS